MLDPDLLEGSVTINFPLRCLSKKPYKNKSYFHRKPQLHQYRQHIPGKKVQETSSPNTAEEKQVREVTVPNTLSSPLGIASWWKTTLTSWTYYFTP